jgi:hypothetical protein
MVAPVLSFTVSPTVSGAVAAVVALVLAPDVAAELAVLSAGAPLDAAGGVALLGEEAGGVAGLCGEVMAGPLEAGADVPEAGGVVP